MKTIVAELLLLPVLVVTGYVLLVMYGFLRPMESSDRSTIAQFGALIIPLLIVLAIGAQILMLLCEWSRKMKWRWAIVLTLLFVPFALRSAGADPRESFYVFGIYLVVLFSWFLGFQQIERANPNMTQSGRP